MIVMILILKSTTHKELFPSVIIAFACGYILHKYLLILSMTNIKLNTDTIRGNKTDK